MLEPFEQAFAKYYSQLRIVPVPLISWDVFIGHKSEIDNYNAIQKEWIAKENFREKVYRQKREIIITNANQEIVFATQGIHQMNGYHPYEIIGKSPKIFQGNLTSDEARSNIKKALQNNLPFKEVIINYTKNGTTYLCEIEAYPKFNKKGELLNYIAFERIAS
jgi:PAS domain S-box-containing protein